MQILVALATTRSSEKLGPLAVQEAIAHHGAITILMVTEKTELERVYQLHCDPILQGTRTLEDILHEIELEHRRMLEEQALHIDQEATAAGIEVEKRLSVGDYQTEILAELAKRPYGCLLYLRHGRGFIARFFLGADEDEAVCVRPDENGHWSVNVED